MFSVFVVYISPLIQQDLDRVKEELNLLKIRKYSRVNEPAQS